MGDVEPADRRGGTPRTGANDVWQVARTVWKARSQRPISMTKSVKVEYLGGEWSRYRWFATRTTSSSSADVGARSSSDFGGHANDRRRKNSLPSIVERALRRLRRIRLALHDIGRRSSTILDFSLHPDQSN